jgi:hypothetical protein
MDMRRGPIGPLRMSISRAINGLVLLRHAGLELLRR